MISPSGGYRYGKRKKLSEADSKRLDDMNKTIEKYEKEGYRHTFLTAQTGKVYSCPACCWALYPA